MLKKVITFCNSDRTQKRSDIKEVMGLVCLNVRSESEGNSTERPKL